MLFLGSGARHTGKAENVFYALAEYVAMHGKGPKIVCLGLARTTGAIDFQMVEKCKDGRFLSGKCRPTLARYKRPHFLVFSNSPPPGGCLSAGRLVVADLRGGAFRQIVDVGDHSTLTGGASGDGDDGIASQLLNMGLGDTNTYGIPPTANLPATEGMANYELIGPAAAPPDALEPPGCSDRAIYNNHGEVVAAMGGGAPSLSRDAVPPTVPSAR